MKAERSVEKQLQGQDYTKNLVAQVMTLSQKDSPETVEELEKRIDGYFLFCAENAMKPSITGLSLSLGIDRRTFWVWMQKGKGRDPKAWRKVCRIAHSRLETIIETALLEQKINPVSGIFQLKANFAWNELEVRDMRTNEEEQDHSFVYPVLGETAIDAEYKELPENKNRNQSASIYPVLTPGRKEETDLL